MTTRRATTVTMIRRRAKSMTRGRATMMTMTRRRVTTAIRRGRGIGRHR